MNIAQAILDVIVIYACFGYATAGALLLVYYDKIIEFCRQDPAFDGAADAEIAFLFFCYVCVEWPKWIKYVFQGF